jgi:hypothetical protein
MPPVSEETDPRLEETVHILRMMSPLTPAKLGEELGCSATVAYRLLTLLANSRKWSPFIFQRSRGAERSPLKEQFLYHDPRVVTANVVMGVKNLQEQMFRMEAKLDALLAENELGPKQS